MLNGMLLIIGCQSWRVHEQLSGADGVSSELIDPTGAATWSLQVLMKLSR